MRWGALQAARAAGAVAVLLCALSCSRTALDTRPPDAGPPPPDAGFDAGFDAGRDAGHDAGHDAGMDAGHCVAGHMTLPRAQVDVVFAIDSSTSMGWVPEDSADGLTRWAVLQIALRDAFEGFDVRARSGALFFPSSGRCYVSQELPVPLARDNIASVTGGFEGRVLSGRSPIAHALSKAGLALVDQAPHGQNRFVILITDGDDTCASGMGRVPATPDASQLLARYGIRTHTVRVDRRARDPGGAGFRGLDELRGILRGIADMLGGCVFDVPLERSADALVEVRVGGELVPRGWDGWQWSGADGVSLSLRGDTCQARLRSNAPVELTFSCE